MALLVTHGGDVLQHKLKLLQSELQVLFPGELFEADSQDPGHEFLALHFSWYNRYSESVGFSIVHLCLHLNFC